MFARCLHWQCMQQLTCATRGGSVSRPLEPREAGSREMMDTAKGMVFWLLMMSAATASGGGNRNSLHARACMRRHITLLRCPNRRCGAEWLAHQHLHATQIHWHHSNVASLG